MTQSWERSTPTNVSWFDLWGLSLLLVYALRRPFFSGFSGFSPSTKTNIFKFSLDQVKGTA